VQSASSGEESEEAVVYPTFVQEVPIHRYRILFSDGTVEDWLASRDDSTLRGEILANHWKPKGPDPTNPKDKNQRFLAGVVDRGVDSVHAPTPGGAATDTPKRRIRREPLT